MGTDEIPTPRDPGLPDAIFTDVFDTVLLRRPVSERRRQYRAAETFVRAGFEGGNVPRRDAVAAVYWARRKAQWLAFRALSAHGDQGEVRLRDVHSAQATILGLDVSAAETLRRIEIDIEKTCLRANTALVARFRKDAATGTPVFAISDTMLDTQSLTELIDHIAGPGLFTRIYSSADIGKTKRAGTLFDHVLDDTGLDPARVVHIGDDPLADGRRAREAGLRTQAVPRPRSHWLRTKADGARFELGRKLSEPPVTSGRNLGAHDFGRDVLGPVYAAFCVQLWLYLHLLDDSESAAALFCARGGLMMRELYESALGSLGLPSRVPSRDFMVSRYVLAKSGLAQADPATLREIAREHAGRRLDEVVRSFSQEAGDVPPRWQVPFTAAAMQEFLASPDARAFKREAVAHNNLFNQHLDTVLDGARRAVLVDTGLYGSIQLFLQTLRPDLAVSSVLMARSNYKGFPTEHFASVLGVLTERDIYDPFDDRSVVLRYWQLVEEMFEPDLQSVKSFAETGGQVVSNLESAGWRDAVTGHDHPVYTGMKAYIESLSPGDLPRILREERAAWKALKRVVIYPTRSEAHELSVGLRPRDFGLDGYASDTSNMGESRLLRFRHAHWKNGAAHSLFAGPARPIQMGMELGYVARNARRRLGKRAGKK